jgi:uncharacterized membrane protein YbaN (DUF454 family)
MSKFKKYTFIIIGMISTAFGIIGIFIPVLPTTPFLVLAAILFSNSSERFLNWLYTNRLCGNYIKNYREGNGLPIKQKIFTVLLLWLTIGTSVIFFTEKLWIRILLLVIALAVTLHLVFIKTYKPKAESQIRDLQNQEDISKII